MGDIVLGQLICDHDGVAYFIASKYSLNARRLGDLHAEEADWSRAQDGRRISEAHLR